MASSVAQHEDAQSEPREEPARLPHVRPALAALRIGSVQFQEAQDCFRAGILAEICDQLIDAGLTPADVNRAYAARTARKLAEATARHG